MRAVEFTGHRIDEAYGARNLRSRTIREIERVNHADVVDCEQAP